MIAACLNPAGLMRISLIYLTESFANIVYLAKLASPMHNFQRQLLFCSLLDNIFHRMVDYSADYL